MRGPFLHIQQVFNDSTPMGQPLLDFDLSIQCFEKNSEHTE